MLEIGQSYTEDVFFTQLQVENFILLSGDNNPIHFDKEYAKTTIFNKPIVHGFLAGSCFSKILGTKLPGYGTIYLNQSLNFIKPVYVEEMYYCTITVLEIKKNKVTLETILFKKDGSKVIEGIATVLINVINNVNH